MGTITAISYKFPEGPSHALNHIRQKKYIPLAQEPTYTLYSGTLFWVVILMTLLFRVQYSGPLFSETHICTPCKAMLNKQRTDIYSRALYSRAYIVDCCVMPIFVEHTVRVQL